MSYANKSIYNNGPEEVQLDSKAWAAYAAIMIGALAMNPSTYNSIAYNGTDAINHQSKYEVMLGFSKTDEKEQEIDSIKLTIASKLGIEIKNHWLPNTGMDKECLFFQCNLENTILTDHEKYSQLELEMYLASKDILDKSKHFDMVAMI